MPKQHHDPLPEQETAENSGGQPRRPSNGLERLNVSSGVVVCIDQFMLGNSQFLSLVGSPDDRDSLNEALERYNSCAVDLKPGTYVVHRDPVAKLVLIAPETFSVASDQLPETEESFPSDDVSIQRESLNRCVEERKKKWNLVSGIYIDNRCMVLIDADLIYNSDLMKQYRDLRSKQDAKAARDLLRQNGAAVRYGFNSTGDELAVSVVPDENLVALWPDAL